MPLTDESLSESWLSKSFKSTITLGALKATYWCVTSGVLVLEVIPFNYYCRCTKCHFLMCHFWRHIKCHLLMCHFRSPGPRNHSIQLLWNTLFSRGSIFVVFLKLTGSWVCKFVDLIAWTKFWKFAFERNWNDISQFLSPITSWWLVCPVQNYDNYMYHSIINS